MYSLPFLMTVPLDRSVHVTADLVTKGQGMRVLHEPMKLVRKPLHEYELKLLLEKGRKLVEWMCVYIIASYCSYIPDGKDISARWHGVAVKEQCGMCMVTENYFQWSSVL